MLSDCVISGLYVRVLKLTLKKFDFYEFFSIFLLFQCEAFGRSLLTFVRISGPDGTLLESGREWSLIVRTGPV
jgi:hypothetical protein